MKSACLAVGVLASSVLIFGCSPAADPIGKAAIHFQIAYPTDPGVEFGCDNPGAGGIGDPPPDLPVGGMVSDLGGTVTDGQALENTNGNYVVECTVTGGDNHRIEVNAEGPNSSPNSGPTDVGTLARVSISGSIGDDGVGEGAVTVGIPNTGPNSSLPEYPCTFQAVAEDGDPDAYQVAAGEAVFTFTCPRAESSLSEFGICETRGTVVIRGCLEK